MSKTEGPVETTGYVVPHADSSHEALAWEKAARIAAVLYTDGYDGLSMAAP